MSMLRVTQKYVSVYISAYKLAHKLPWCISQRGQEQVGVGSMQVSLGRTKSAWVGTQVVQPSV